MYDILNIQIMKSKLITGHDVNNNVSHDVKKKHRHVLGRAHVLAVPYRSTQLVKAWFYNKE